MSRAAMTKVEALDVVALVARMGRQPTPTRWRKLLRAFDALGLTIPEQEQAAARLDLIDRNGAPFYVEGVTVPWPVKPKGD